jgi:hypothetical protein
MLIVQLSDIMYYIGPFGEYQATRGAVARSACLNISILKDEVERDRMICAGRGLVRDFKVF